MGVRYQVIILWGYNKLLLYAVHTVHYFSMHGWCISYKAMKLTLPGSTEYTYNILPCVILNSVQRLK